MQQDNGQPSGANKNDQGTGIPAGKLNDDLQRDQELTDRYTADDQDIAGSVRTNNSNRNTDKDDTEGH